VIDRIRDWSAGVGDRIRSRRSPAEAKPRKSTATALRTAIPPAKPAAPPPVAPAVDPELLAARDRLIEKFTIMQADLGGAFYEMAIRDHVRLDALTKKAAELQAVDAELGAVERSIELERTGAVGHCSHCNAPYGPGVAFCSQCGQVIERVIEPAPATPATNGSGA
jgi:hypothetical protein